jgi:hypothetical protein
MKAMLRRLENLERALGPATPRVTGVALQTGAGNLMALDGEWVPCPDVARASMHQPGVPVKMYIGFDPREVTA